MKLTLGGGECIYLSEEMSLFLGLSYCIPIIRF